MPAKLVILLTFHLLKNMFCFLPLVGFNRNLSLLEIVLLVPRGLNQMEVTAWQQFLLLDASADRKRRQPARA